MSKIDISALPDILTEEGVEPQTQTKILEHIQKLIEEEKENKERVTRPKAQLGVILIDENNELKNDNIGALIYEIPADGKHDDVLSNIRKSVTEFNNTKKGQKSPIKSFTEAFQVVKPKIFKNNGGVKKRTKEITRCLVSNNKV